MNSQVHGVIHGSLRSSETAWLTSLTSCAPVQVKVRAYGAFAPEITQADLERFFYLDAFDRNLIALRRTDHHRLGYALQIGTMRCVGRFLEDPLDAPWAAAEYLSRRTRAARPGRRGRRPPARRGTA